MSLEPSSSKDAGGTSQDNVDHSPEEDHNHAVNTILSNKKIETHCYKYGNEVFTKYKDWDLTQTENHASNDNVNNGNLSANVSTLSNEKPKKELNVPKIIGDIPDSWGVAMSIKRALWDTNEINQHMMLNNGGAFGRASKKATQIVILTEKACDKKNALFTLFNETKKEDYQGTIIYVLSDSQANIIVALIGEHEKKLLSIQSNHEKSKQEKAVEDFKNKEVKILVVTSSVPIEKDLPDVKMVVNFDLPNTGEEYLHRIGRDGQSDIPDKVISFFDPKRDSKIAAPLLDILQEAGQKIPGFLPHCCFHDAQMVNKTTVKDEKQVTNPN